MIVYSKNNCPACMRMKAFLKSKNIEYEEKNIDVNLDAMDFVVKHKHRTMPVVYQDDWFIPDPIKTFS